jgi:hypothetical protein
MNSQGVFQFSTVAGTLDNMFGELALDKSKEIPIIMEFRADGMLFRNELEMCVFHVF